MTDDLGSGDADCSVEFALDGVAYTIDLSDSNAVKLRDALQPFIDAARRANSTGTSHRSSRPTRPSTSTSRAAVSNRRKADDRRTDVDHPTPESLPVG
ncbi:Lsr2 dimerization domain-containing protein [Actinoplanes sp. CA-030573]|uniref:Lsr2 dimerization domain-containing protein n=1 Tax=Actinoplanes sp. CA-030573 TaxID=3239898 RepID=UPI003D94DA9A